MRILVFYLCNILNFSPFPFFQVVRIRRKEYLPIIKVHCLCSRTCYILPMPGCILVVYLMFLSTHVFPLVGGYIKRPDLILFLLFLFYRCVFSVCFSQHIEKHIM